MKRIAFVLMVAFLVSIAGCSLLGGALPQIEITVSNGFAGYYVKVTDVTTNVMLSDSGIFYHKSEKYTINKGDTLLFEWFGEYDGTYHGATSASYDSTQTVTVNPPTS